jgi:N-hydroxyarylamine O-acetyltransferase
MRLSDYLKRIGFQGDPRPDVATLRALHRAHQYAIPFEDLDVQLGRATTIDVGQAFEKIVHCQRGGWCYEMNGAFGWVLEQIGFEVTRMSAGVMRERVGDVQLGNHLCLLVHLDRPWLADVGFGGSLSEPIALHADEHQDRPYRIWLSDAGDRYWRFSEQTHGDPFSFDFRAEPADEALLAAKCAFLQTDPTSSFVQNLVVQRRSVDTHLSLRGRVLTTTTGSSTEKQLINSADELVAVLRSTFALDVPEAAVLWPAICARHDALFGASA